MYVIVKATPEGDRLVPRDGRPALIPNQNLAEKYCNDLNLSNTSFKYQYRYRVDPASEWTAEIMALEIKRE